MRSANLRDDQLRAKLGRDTGAKKVTFTAEINRMRIVNVKLLSSELIGTLSSELSGTRHAVRSVAGNPISSRPDGVGRPLPGPPGPRPIITLMLKYERF